MINRKEEYKNWLINNGENTKTISKRLSQIKRINDVYDIDTAFADDKCASILDDFDYYKYINDGSKMSLTGNIYNGLSSLKSTLKNYIKFLESTKPSTNKRVAKFVGNYEGFYSYVNTKCCRIIQDLTRQDKIKRNKGKCSYCGKAVEHLEAAHIKKLSRTDIIRSILDKKYKTKNNLYEVDLVEFERDFKNEHVPLNEHFIYLCHECHQKYDDNKITEDMMQSKALN